MLTKSNCIISKRYYKGFHYLVILVRLIQVSSGIFESVIRGKKAPKRLTITQLKNTNAKQCFVDILEIRLESTPLASQNVEADRATLRELVYNTATEILGPSTRQHNDWFDENCDEIKQLLDEKHRLHQAYLSSPKSTSKKDAYNTIRKTVQ